MTGAVHRVATLPFDHARRATSALVDDDGERVLVVKGAPEQVLAQVHDGCRTRRSARWTRCSPPAAGWWRWPAKPAPELTAITADDECDLMLAGFLVFADEPKAAARESLAQLAALGIEVKVATGDNPRVAEKVCADLGLASKGTITGAQMEALDDDEFDDAAQNHTIFARISPEQKARLIMSARRTGRSVGFLGDGVNDALALHAADVGISVDTATDVAKDAADVVLLEKDLGVLAAGCRRGPAHLRQHHQVRADGHVEQFRQHVQRGRRLGGAAVPADAAQPDPAEQSALRQLAAGDPHRPGR